MPEAKDIHAIKDLIQLLCEIVNAAIAAPKPLSIKDLSMLLPHIPEISRLAGEIGDVPAELSDLSEEEAMEIVSQVASVLQLEDKKAEAVVSAAMKVAVEAFELVKALKS